MASRMSGRDCLAHASFAACLPAERALIGCCSMDGKGAWRDNVFVERFWRTIKYEEVYLRAYDGVEEARQSIGRYIAFYNARQEVLHPMHLARLRRIIASREKC